MQFHHHGYVSGEPACRPRRATGMDRPDELPDEMDVLIVGSGPAGMLARRAAVAVPGCHDPHHRAPRRAPRARAGRRHPAAQRRDVPGLRVRRAHRRRGVQHRLHELLDARPGEPEEHRPHGAHRGLRVQDQRVPASHRQPGARARLLRRGRRARPRPDRRPTTAWSSSASPCTRTGDYPVEVRVRHVAGARAGEERTVRAKYVAGCDGARSGVREAIGRTHVGDVSQHAWGVMDVLVNTDFPDWRTKCAINAEAGNILHIPREGGYLSRMYVDLGEVAEDDEHRVRQTPIEEIIRKANEILHPYSIDVKQVAWHSVYEVGHRVTDKFDDVPEGSDRTPAGLPHRRRVPHAQRQGRAGHERVDAGRLQPRLEARPRARPAAAPSRCWPPTPPSASRSPSTSSTSTRSGRRSWRASPRRSPTRRTSPPTTSRPPSSPPDS